MDSGRYIFFIIDNIDFLIPDVFPIREWNKGASTLILL